jgi:hypothetical protein
LSASHPAGSMPNSSSISSHMNSPISVVVAPRASRPRTRPASPSYSSGARSATRVGPTCSRGAVALREAPPLLQGPPAPTVLAPTSTGPFPLTRPSPVPGPRSGPTELDHPEQPTETTRIELLALADSDQPAKSAPARSPVLHPCSPRSEQPLSASWTRRSGTACVDGPYPGDGFEFQRSGYFGSVARDGPQGSRPSMMRRSGSRRRPQAVRAAASFSDGGLALPGRRAWGGFAQTLTPGPRMREPIPNGTTSP